MVRWNGFSRPRIVNVGQARVRRPARAGLLDLSVRLGKPRLDLESINSASYSRQTGSFRESETKLPFYSRNNRGILENTHLTSHRLAVTAESHRLRLARARLR